MPATGCAPITCEKTSLEPLAGDRASEPANRERYQADPTFHPTLAPRLHAVYACRGSMNQ
jgi:hypothetical protein